MARRKKPVTPLQVILGSTPATPIEQLFRGWVELEQLDIFFNETLQPFIGPAGDFSNVPQEQLLLFLYAYWWQCHHREGQLIAEESAQQEAPVENVLVGFATGLLGAKGLNVSIPVDTAMASLLERLNVRPTAAIFGKPDLTDLTPSWNNKLPTSPFLIPEEE